MAKIIKLTPEYIDEVRRDFEASLRNLKVADGKISFTKTFGNIDCKATVYFTEVAWQKMMALIREFDKEVAWHGVAFRGDDPEKNEYTITDILVYPQEVTGATVTTDQQKYQMWLMDHEDNVFNNIRMQGHSHVNMSVSPSGVDTSLYERILDQMDDTMFYIFMIYNKRGEKTYKIYDLKKNILFETADVTVKVIGNGFDMDEFMSDAKSKVQNRVQQPYQFGGGTGVYGAGYGMQRSVSNTAPATTPVQQQPKALPPVKTQEMKNNSSQKNFSSSGRRKGKRRNKQTKEDKPYTMANLYDDEYYGYDEDPYGPFGYRDGYWH